MYPDIFRNSGNSNATPVHVAADFGHGDQVEKELAEQKRHDDGGGCRSRHMPCNAGIGPVRDFKNQAEFKTGE